MKRKDIPISNLNFHASTNLTHYSPAKIPLKRLSLEFRVKFEPAHLTALHFLEQFSREI